jgi:hypothetical protein
VGGHSSVIAHSAQIGGLFIIGSVIVVIASCGDVDLFDSRPMLDYYYNTAKTRHLTNIIVTCVIISSCSCEDACLPSGSLTRL